MTTFDERENAFENQLVYDETLRFTIAARRNRLLGLWAAEKLGYSGEPADTYAHDVVQADLEEPGEEDVFRKIRRDFDANGIAQSDHQVRRTMEQMMARAMNETGTGNPAGADR